MLENITRAEWKTDYWYELVYDDGANNGYGFPCSADGEPDPQMTDAARENLEWCRNHPEKFVRFGKVVRFSNRYKEPAKGQCSCGQWVDLVDEYLGACQCERCGKWYNLFGQELQSPEYWETDDEEAYEEAW